MKPFTYLGHHFIFLIINKMNKSGKAKGMEIHVNISDVGRSES